ncbi:hypothetical protein KDM41_12075 [bacterium]|nr:hypothetical protein [bacterium]
MSERKSLSELLRDEAVHHAADAPPASAGDGKWREALLQEFAHGPALGPATHRAPERPPLAPHHLAVLAPTGVGLFVLGWLAGSGRLDFGRLAQIPPYGWAAVAAAAGIGFVLWRGVGSRRTR